MAPNFFVREIRRTTRNLLIAGLCLLSIAGSCASMMPHFLYDAVTGPVDVDGQMLASTSDPEGLPHFVRVSGEKSFYSGLHVVSSRDGERAKYVFLTVAGRLLLVKAPPDEATATTFTGTVHRISADVERQTIGQISDSALRARFVPLQLDVDASFRWFAVFLAGALGLLGVLGVRNVWIAVARFRDPTLHPISRRLARYGAPTAVASEIQDELAHRDSEWIGDVGITSSWLVSRMRYDIDVHRLENLVWAYKRVTTHKRNFVTVGKSYSILVCDRDGKQTMINGPEADADRLVKIIARRAPWIVAGYDDSLWRLFVAKREEFVRVVDKRRQSQLGAAQDQAHLMRDFASALRATGSRKTIMDGVEASTDCVLCQTRFHFMSGLIELMEAKNGAKGFLCEFCARRVNSTRESLGLPPFEIRPGTYSEGPPKKTGA